MRLYGYVFVLAACGGGGGGSGAADAELCGDQSCLEDEHCEERGSGAEWCESAECPAEEVREGQPCTMVGLTCDRAFEFGGYRCTGPENVFVGCLGGTVDSRCPFEAPIAGSPCCWNGLTLDPCTYQGTTSRFWCSSDHWLEIEP